MYESSPNLVGRVVETTDGRQFTLTKVIGYGAQGVVYEESRGKKVVKLYHLTGSTTVDESLVERLRFIRGIKMPDSFVRVEGIITHPCVGFVMSKVDGYVPLNSYLLPSKGLAFSSWYNKGRGLRDRLFLGCILAKAFRELERNDLSYCDISGNNILVRMGRGASIRIIDVDNIYVAGMALPTVFGTPRYIAPEVLSHQRNPDVLSDNYSLAVILFELLRVGHPYISDEVANGTPEDEASALAGELDYVTDENSHNMLPADIVFTPRLKDLFERCFVEGRTNRMARPSARDFEFALLDASNKVIQCPSCGAWHYPHGQNGNYVCPWCDALSAPQARLNFSECIFSSERLGSNSEKYTHDFTTYILREGKNHIKGQYLSKPYAISNENDLFNNILTVAKDSKGYWVYNEFDREGIDLERATSHERVTLGKHEYRLLSNGDKIYFGDEASTSVGNKKFHLTTVASFYEATQ